MAVTPQAGQRPCSQSRHAWCSTPRLPRCRKLPPVPGVERSPGYAGVDLSFKKVTPVYQSSGQCCWTPCSLRSSGLEEGWPTYDPGATGKSNPCSPHGCLTQTALLWGNTDVPRAGRRQASRSRCGHHLPAALDRAPCPPSAPRCPALRPRGVPARPFSCPQRHLPCLWYVSCGSLPFRYLALQATTVGHNWSNAGGEWWLYMSRLLLIIKSHLYGTKLGSSTHSTIQNNRHLFSVLFSLNIGIIYPCLR